MNEHYHFQFERLEKLLEWDFPILLSGESGIGKSFMVHQYAKKHNLNLYVEAYKEDLIFGATEEQAISEKAKKFLEEGGIYLIDEVDKISDKKAVALIDFMESVENKELRLKGDILIKIGGIKIVAIANNPQNIENAIYQRLLGRLEVVEDENLKLNLLPHPEQKDFLKAYQNAFGNVSLRTVLKKFAIINPDWPEEILKTHLEILFPEVRKLNRKSTIRNYKKSCRNNMLRLIYENEFKGKKQDINTFRATDVFDVRLSYKISFDFKFKENAVQYENRVKKVSGFTVISENCYEGESWRVEIRLKDCYSARYEISTDTVYSNCNGFYFLEFKDIQKVILICLREDEYANYNEIRVMRNMMDRIIMKARYAVIIDLKDKVFTSISPYYEDVPQMLVDKLLEFKDCDKIDWGEIESEVKKFSENEIMNLLKEKPVDLEFNEEGNCYRMNSYGVRRLMEYRNAPYLSFAETGFLDHSKLFRLAYGGGAIELY